LAARLLFLSTFSWWMRCRLHPKSASYGRPPYWNFLMFEK